MNQLHRIPLFCFAFLIIGCGATLTSYSPQSSFAPDDPRQITDDDIRKAFEARPQILPPVKLAQYSMSNDDYFSYFKKIQGTRLVDEVYRIPTELVDGVSNYSRDDYRYYDRFQERKPINLKYLRLLAARARSDILVIVANDVSIHTRTNEWGCLYPLIIPSFFTPHRDFYAEMTTRAFVLDVRNGYLYKDYTIKPTKIQKNYVYSYQLEDLREEAEKALYNESSNFLANDLQNLLQQSESVN